MSLDPNDALEWPRPNGEGHSAVEAHIRNAIVAIDPGQESRSVVAQIESEAQLTTHPDHPLSIGDRVTIGGQERVITEMRVAEGGEEVTYIMRGFIDRVSLIPRHNCSIIYPEGFEVNCAIGVEHINCRSQAVIPVPTLEEQIRLINAGPTQFPFSWWPDDVSSLPFPYRQTVMEIDNDYPDWKLWQIDTQLKKMGLEPRIDHEESVIMPGYSKGSAAYIQHNNNFKRFIEELCPDE